MLERVYIELSDFCGLKCSFCPHSRTSTRRGKMSLHFFERILKQLSMPKRLTKLLHFHILGDPLARDDLGDFLRTAGEYGFKVDLVSSGKFLDSEKFEMLSQPPVHQIAFSLSAFVDNPKSFGTQYLEQILKFCEFARGRENGQPVAQKSEIFINLRLQDVQLDSEISKNILERISDFFGVDFENLDSENAVKFGEQSFRLDYKTFLKIKRRYEWILDSENLDSKSADLDDKNGAKLQNLKCYGVSKQIGILSNGVVVPCCIDCFGEIALGDLRTQSLEQILNSERAQKIVNGFKNGVAIEPKCAVCDYARGLKINLLTNQ